MILIANEIAPSVSGVDILRVIFVWFPVLINRLRILPFYLGSIVEIFRLIIIANETAPSVSGVDISQIVFLWFSVLINRLRIFPFDLGLIVPSF